jgi:phosphoribulokinase
MSKKHPIIAVTGSSGAGTTTLRHAFANIFRREGINAAYVEGDSFLRYNKKELEERVDASHAAGNPVSNFGPDLNLFDLLEALYKEYGKKGTGKIRSVVRDEQDAVRYGRPIGEFTAWNDIAPGSDLLLYEGNHGGVVSSSWTRRRSSPAHFSAQQERRGNDAREKRGVDAAQWVDLLIGVVPSVNLEWIQKIHRDCSKDGCTVDEVTSTILRRMSDYVHFIVPQFSLTDINFQRVPLVDTSNPFIARDIPSADESMVVIHFRDPKEFDFPTLMRRLDGSFMSRPNTMVVPGGKMEFAMEVICTPRIHAMMDNKRSSTTSR